MITVEHLPSFTLRNRRKAKGYKTGASFARKIGIKSGTWNACELNNRLPCDYLTAQKVRKLLDIPDDVTSIEPMRFSYGGLRPVLKVAEAPVQATDEAATPLETLLKQHIQRLT